MFERLHDISFLRLRAEIRRIISSFPTTLATKIMHMHTQPSFPLLRLPAEIRNRVYFFVFRSTIKFRVKGPWVYKRDKDDVSGFREVIRTNAPLQFLSVLLTCRQIYNETRLLPFSTNILDINDATIVAPSEILSAEQRASVMDIYASVSLNSDTDDVEPARSNTRRTLAQLTQVYKSRFPNLQRLVIHRHFRVHVLDGSVANWKTYCLARSKSNNGLAATTTEDFKQMLRENHEETLKSVTEAASKELALEVRWVEPEVHYMEHYDFEGPCLQHKIEFLSEAYLEECFCYSCHRHRGDSVWDFTMPPSSRIYRPSHAYPNAYPYYI